MPLKPFNKDGLSINVFSSGCLFLYCDERQQYLRCYLRAAIVTDYLQQQPAMLMSILRFSAPDTICPMLRLGMDDRGNLWLSSDLPLAQASNAATLQTHLTQFMEQAMVAKERLQERINEAATATVGATTVSTVSAMQALSTHQAAAQSKAAAPAQSGDDLMNLMRSSQVLWG